jgi:hypothetical protein
MNLNYLNLDETQVMIASTITSFKWITIFGVICLIIYGIINYQKNKT